MCSGSQMIFTAVGMIEPLETAQVVGGDMTALNCPRQHCRNGRQPVVGLTLTGCMGDPLTPSQKLTPDPWIVKRGNRHVTKFGFGLRQHAPVFSLGAGRQCSFQTRWTA